MIYLDEKYLKIVKDILREHIPDRKVVVCGSRVTGKIKPYSDLDLCIMGNEVLSLSKLGYLREAFSESNLPIRVDLVEWAYMSPECQETVSQQSEVI